MRHALKLTPSFLFVFLVMTACSSGNSSQAREELARLNVEYSDANFIENARQGNADVVHHFLDAGMNTEVKTREGQTALMVAALANQPEVVKVLLEHGADVDAKNKYDGTALMSAAWCNPPPTSTSIALSTSDTARLVSSLA